ncbi:MAG: VWA domain-containing protein [Acidimicrobiales bacterium]
MVLTAVLLATACGEAGDTDTASSDPTVATSVVPSGDRGWLEGDDLEWFDSSGGLDESGDDMAMDMDMATEASDGDSEFREIGPIDPRPDDSPLQAGSIDDGDDVAAYLEYRAGVLDSGLRVRPLDVTDSTVFTVTGSNGLPVLDAAVEFWDPAADRATGTPLVTLRTTADGSVRFAPAAMAADAAELAVVVRVGDVATDVAYERGVTSVDVSVEAPGGVDGSVPLDVHFVIDATGSMGDEISRLRDNMTSIANQIAALPSAPDVRFGMTVYRDVGDLFVTRTFDLTDDLSSFLDALADVQAEGGGDYPEALDEALADALEKPEWRRDGAVELMFVIADAPNQVERDVQTPATATAVAAAEAGVKIFPVAASGTDDQAEYVMRELAFVTGGRFVFLSYGVAGAGTATGPSSDISADDYDELPLDALVVRLVQDELEALTGDEQLPPETTTTSLPVTTTTFEQ